MMMMMMKGLFPVNHALNIPKLLHMARDCDCTLLIEAVLLLSTFQKLHEQRMIEIYHRHHESLLLLSLTYFYGQAPLRHISSLLTALPLMVMVMTEMPVKAPRTFLSVTHFQIERNPSFLLLPSPENFRRRLLRKRV